MRKRKVCLSIDISAFLAHTDPVDENLFYKGVDKHKVDPARLAQHHQEELSNASSDPTLPPYAFHSGDSLLALTRKHNVSPSSYYSIITDPQIHRTTPQFSLADIHVLPSDHEPGAYLDSHTLIKMTIAQIVYDNERQFHSDEEIHGKVRVTHACAARSFALTDRPEPYIFCVYLCPSWYIS